MESAEFDELQDLRERNNELVKKLQYWKVTAAERENHNLELMKEINDLWLKLSRLRSGGAAQSRKLDAALQTAGEEALTHLVQASTAVTRSIELTKTFILERQELERASPRWSAISNTPTEKIHRVPPMMGGRTIQPVVALSRTIVDNNNDATLTSRNTSPTQDMNDRAVPFTLQDVYIPLTRINMADLQNNSMETDPEDNAEDSDGDILEQSGAVPVNESQNLTDDDLSRRLDVVVEEIEPEDVDTSPPQLRADNPIEGPSWLLDVPRVKISKKVVFHNTSPAHEFTPTVRRRKHATSPPPSPIIDPVATSQGPCHNSPREPHHSLKIRFFSPRPSCRSPKPAHLSPSTVSFSPRPLHHSPRPSLRELSPSPGSSSQNIMKCRGNGRVLKLIVPKLRLEDAGAGDASPRKRHMLLDAPSPNGATDAGVIVLVANHTTNDTTANVEPNTSCIKKRRESRDMSSSYERDSRPDSRGSRDSDSGGEKGVRRVRRQRKVVSYKEKSLNRASSSEPDCRADSYDSDSGGETVERRARRQRKVVTYREKPLNRKMRR